MAPHLNHEDFAKIAKTINDGLRPYVRELVEREAALIPHMIREQIAELIIGGLRSELRDVVQKSITIRVEVKATE